MYGPLAMKAVNDCSKLPWGNTGLSVSSNLKKVCRQVHVIERAMNFTAGLYYTGIIQVLKGGQSSLLAFKSVNLQGQI